MNEYPLLTKKEVKRNRSLKTIQKEYYKNHRGVKGRFLKARISKVVKLRRQDFFYDFTVSVDAKEKPHKYTRDQLIEAVSTMDICGLGGGGFPTGKKLQTLCQSNATDKYLIINGAECDPGLLHDAWLLQNRLNELEEGIRLLAEVFSFKKIILAARDALPASGKDYEVVVVPDRYPMGAERILIEYLLGISLDASDIPAKRGILIMNVQTLHAVYEALYLNRSVTSRFLTVADLTTGEAMVVRAWLGTSITELIENIAKKSLKQPVYAGGGILSASKAAPADTITVKTNFIGFGKEVTYAQNAKCKGCGVCARKCPMKIKVNKIVQNYEKNNYNFLKFHPELCIRCGGCTYHCAAGMNTMELVSAASSL